MSAIAGVALGLVFLAAAVSKLSVRGWARDTAAALRVPFRLTQSAPAVELLIGAGLVTRVRFMPEAALGVLLIYTGVLLIQISREDAPPCACFGRAAKPITWATVARNAVLVALAVISWFG
ncbi:MAG: Methylamine utilization protein MauE [Actinomycetota bacterium]